MNRYSAAQERRRTGQGDQGQPQLAIATNNGDIGGGEVMLLNIAEALRGLGIDVLVVGPSAPGDLIALAHSRGFRTSELPATGRRDYIAALRRWRRRHRTIPLWCNGLVPSFATAGLGPRIVHLHIVPEGLNAVAARIAAVGAQRVLVPSKFMASRVRGATVLPNWTEEILFEPGAAPAEGPLRVGYLGRLTRAKGVDTLAEAMAEVHRNIPQGAHLVLAGENRFGDAADDAAISAALAPIEGQTDRLGWVDREDFFDAVDLAVFPSSWQEPFGLVAAEAMAAGTPFVITDSGALPEVAGSEHPWVAECNDAEDLAGVITRALEDVVRGDGARALAARERWGQEYSPTAGTVRVAQLLQQLSLDVSTPDEETAR